MGGHEARSYWEHWGLIWLWTAFFLAPAAWFFNQGLSYMLMKWVCASGAKGVLTGIAATAFVMTLGGAWLGWSLLKDARAGHEDGGAIVDRSQFLALVAIGFNLLSLVLIATATTSRFILSPCE